MPENEKHDWDALFQRSSFTMKRGKDYTSKTRSMVVMIRRSAKERGITVSLNVDSEKEEIVVTVKRIDPSKVLKKIAPRGSHRI